MAPVLRKRTRTADSPASSAPDAANSTTAMPDSADNRGDDEKMHVTQRYTNIADLICPLISTKAEFERHWFQAMFHHEDKDRPVPIPIEKRFTFTNVEQDVFHRIVCDRPFPPFERYKLKSYTTGPERILTFAVESPYHHRLVSLMRDCIQKTIDVLQRKQDKKDDFGYAFWSQALGKMYPPYIKTEGAGKHLAADVPFIYEVVPIDDVSETVGDEHTPAVVVDVAPAVFHEQDASFWLSGKRDVKFLVMVDLYPTTDNRTRVDVSSWWQERSLPKREILVSAEQDADGNRRMLDPAAQISIPYKRLFPANNAETAKHSSIVIDNKYILRLFDVLKAPSLYDDDWPFDEFEKVEDVEED